jgi:DNA-binding transcriptional LysR family regulator
MRPQELNLLVIFDSVMTEKSITRTAERLSMTQPAVSNAVARMRTAWKDELFVKDGRNIQPTTFAKNLWQQIKEPLHNLNQAIEPDAFDPKTAKRTFRIAVTDIIVDSLWLEMRRFFEQQAPGINLHAVPYTIENAQRVLDDAEVDLVISSIIPDSSSISSSHLFDTCFLCAMRADHPLAKPDLSVAEFAAAEHLLVSLSGDSYGVTDKVLHQHGLTRRIAMTVNHFSSAAPLLMETDLIAILPAGAIYKHVASGKLSVTRCPVEIPRSSISMLWHKRQDNDAGLKWLREHIEQKFVARWNKNLEQVYNFACQ